MFQPLHGHPLAVRIHKNENSLATSVMGSKIVIPMIEISI
jgi:hypothetical protein